MSSVRVLDIPVDRCSKNALLAHIQHSIEARSGNLITYVNVYVANLYRTNARVRDYLLASKVRYCDGEGIRLAAWILGKEIPARIALTHWIWELAKWCSEKRYSVFLLGAKEGPLNAAMDNLKERAPNLKVAGHHGYFEPGENNHILDEIRAAQPDVLFVGLGLPRQAIWIMENRKMLNVGVILPCGMMIDYLSGAAPVAPRWMQRTGTEWLYRLVQEPARLWSRYLIGNPLFIGRVLLQLIKEGKQE